MGRSKHSKKQFVPSAPFANTATNNPAVAEPAPVRTAPENQRQGKPLYSEALASSSSTSFPPLKPLTRIAHPSAIPSSKPAIQSSKPSNKAESGRSDVKESVPTRVRQMVRSSGSKGGPATKTIRSGSRNTGATPRSTVPNEVKDMNEHLTERFGRRSALSQASTSTATSRPTMQTNLNIRKYVKASNRSANPSHWTGFPDVPSAEEINDYGNQNQSTAIEVPENIVVGPYESKEDYLERHYALLREDAVAPLRTVVAEAQKYPHLIERESEHNAYLYEKVFVTGLIFANSGIAARITFSLRRVGKKVNWEQSKRLLTGTMIALTPADDIFKTCCHVATVAARPLESLQRNPPEIDIFFGSTDEIEIDPQQEWLMVESRNGFYEGYRHTLQGLQMLATEEFPLSNHIVDMERDVEPPAYVEEQPEKDLSALFPTDRNNVRNVNVLTDWPDLPSQLDHSQMEALRRILFKRLAIVQGPPGTGKTYVSVTAIKTLLDNLATEDPPVLVAAHTNHALDQLLRHIAVFEPNFIRLGGWTKDVDTIMPRTLYEIKTGVRVGNPLGSLRGPSLQKIKQLAKEAILLLEPLTQNDEPLSAALFHDFHIISDAQYESLIRGSKDWVRAGPESGCKGEIAIWLADECIEARQRTLPEDFGIEVEEADLEFEQLKELEAESKLIDEEDFDTLRGPRVIFSEPFTGRKIIGMTDEAVQAELKKGDLWKIPPKYRGPVYRSMQRSAKDILRHKFRALAAQYSKASQEAKIGRWEVDFNFLKEARVIGATTTGLCKYRGLLQALNPRTVLIEEAAETLEAPIAVACFHTLQQLILVGDHQQLRAHCNEEELAGNPFYLDVSMMERLVVNKVDFTQLKRQRRMVPEIRRIIDPIYNELEDHQAVHHRKAIPGMDVNSFFFSHNGRWNETRDDQSSAMNTDEAEMVVNFFTYLTQNGMRPSEITILTFYNGQRKLILKKLREHSQLPLGYYNVVTVDSYQGEENRCILLSLVRSNEDAKIGFLEVENRVCVALSRAQCGFYIFGDAPLLCRTNMLWWQVTQEMGRSPRRIGFHLPLKCQKHQQITYIRDHHEILSLNGGCQQLCPDRLDCGHACGLKCHPFSHDQILCRQPCIRLLDCGHACVKSCCDECQSQCACCDVVPLEVSATSPSTDIKQQVNRSRPRTPEPQPSQEEHEAFDTFATGGHLEADSNLAILSKQEYDNAERERLDNENFAALFGEPSGLPACKDNFRIVRTKSEKNGGHRSVWKGTFQVPKAQGKMPRKEERSLLDL